MLMLGVLWKGILPAWLHLCAYMVEFVCSYFSADNSLVAVVTSWYSGRLNLCVSPATLTALSHMKLY